MKICFISYKYPGKHDPSAFVFVKHLVDAIASHGHHCIVIAPFNITHYRRLSYRCDEYYPGKGCVTVIMPGYFSFSNIHLGRFRPSAWLHRMAVKRAFRKLKERPDIVYCHFWSSGYEGFSYAQKNRIPLFVATGESDIKSMFSIPSDVIDFKDYVRGVICVSSKNRDESIDLGLTTYDKCIVLPNAVDSRLFMRMDKQRCREQLGFPANAFIIVFVGWFNDRKGSERVASAIKEIEGEAVYSIFIGKGEKEPCCDNILFKGALSHDRIPMYLNSADVFVLPTLHEGCCNAVVEAMACGLPVISSNRSFNWDVLDESNSILIEPDSIDDIAGAISRLRDDPMQCRLLSRGALLKAKQLSIDRRAQLVLNFINEKLIDYE